MHGQQEGSLTNLMQRYDKNGPGGALLRYADIMRLESLEEVDLKDSRFTVPRRNGYARNASWLDEKALAGIEGQVYHLIVDPKNNARKNPWGSCLVTTLTPAVSASAIMGEAHRSPGGGS